MWLTAADIIGISAWVDEDSAWRLIAERCPIVFHVGEISLTLRSSDGSSLPPIDEQFVRGEGIHLRFPQRPTSDEFGFQLVLRRVFADAVTEVFEALVSVQTSLLDSNPTLDLGLKGEEFNVIGTASTGLPLHCCSTSQYDASILLGPHDAPSSEVQATRGGTTVRLFGHFLEKGVIRRARPWLVVGRRETPHRPSLDQTRLCEIWQQLSESALPLD
ncbi:MAG: hypothetical protein AAF802_05000 [Planctomycetota bacterium]